MGKRVGEDMDIAYNTAHRERYLAYGSRLPTRRSWISRHQRVNT